MGLIDEIRRGEHGPDLLADLFASCDDPLHEAMVGLMSRYQPMTARALTARTNGSRADVDDALQHLIRIGRVRAAVDNGYLSAL